MRRMAMPLLLLYLMILLTACDEHSGTARAAHAAAPVDPQVYGAAPALFKLVTRVHVQNDFGGDIIIVAHELGQGQGKEVGLDYTAYDSSTNPVAGSADARRAVTVTMDYKADGLVEIWARGTGQPPNSPKPGQSVRLHIRVPRNTNLDLGTSSGRVTVTGEVNEVRATATNRIEVHGALGGMILTTTMSGGIVADGGYDHHIETKSRNGDITIFSVGASVTADITGTGGIEFVGTLNGRDNSFQTYSGPITITLPEDVPYGFDLSTISGQLASDFRPHRGGDPARGLRPVCGLIEKAQNYDFHVRQLDDIYGHLYIPLANVGTYISGTLGTDLYYFFTDRGDVTIYTPYPHVVHLYAADPSDTARIVKGVPDCGQLPPEPEVRFKASTQSGFVFIHHTFMDRKYASGQ